MYEGYVDKNITPKSKYRLVINGVTIKATEISEPTKTGKVVDLPDRSVAPSGTNEKSEFEVTIPDHHDVDRIFMQTWYNECCAGGDVPITAMRQGALIRLKNDGSTGSVDKFINAFCIKETPPGANKSEADQMATRKFTIVCDEIVS